MYRYGQYIIDVIWDRRAKRWVLKVNGERVEELPNITAVNAFMRESGDDFRAGTFTSEAYQDRHATVTIQMDDADTDELARLRLPSPA